MAIITNTTLQSNAFINIFDVINNRSNITDPRHADNTSNKVRQLVYDYDPFDMSIDFNRMPYIILKIPTLAYSVLSADGKYKNLDWTQSIIVRTARYGASNFTVDTGRRDILNLSDDLHKTFNSETIKQSLRRLNIYAILLNEINQTTLTVDQKYVYESEFQLNYSIRLKVTD